MKIIKKGVVKKSTKIYRVGCQFCDGIVEYTEDDLFSTNSARVIECPTRNCNTLLIHKESYEVPPPPPKIKRRSTWFG